MATAEYRPLLMRANRLLGSALIEHNLVKFEDLEAANERLLGGVDVLVAIWDGKGAQGQAGTAQVVARARALRLPIAWVHAGNRKPGTMQPTSLGADHGRVTYENL